MARPGDAGGDCVRCDEPTVLVGVDHGVVAAWCRACDLLHPLAYHDVYLSTPHMAVEPADVGEELSGRGENGNTGDDAPGDRRPDR